MAEPKRVHVEFATENAAFTDNPDELAEVMQQAARKAVEMIHNGAFPANRILRDSNGNYIGNVDVK